MTRASGPVCATCLRIRAFLVTGCALVVLMYLQPAAAIAAARLLPDPVWIGVGLCLLGGLVFGWRLYRHAGRDHSARR